MICRSLSTKAFIPADRIKVQQKNADKTSSLVSLQKCTLSVSETWSWQSARRGVGSQRDAELAVRKTRSWQSERRGVDSSRDVELAVSMTWSDNTVRLSIDNYNDMMNRNMSNIFFVTESYIAF